MRATNTSIAKDEGLKLKAAEGNVSILLSLHIPISAVGNREAVIYCLSRETRWTVSDKKEERHPAMGKEAFSPVKAKN